MDENQPGPPSAWPLHRVVFWTVLALLLVAWQLPNWATAFHPGPGRFLDFSQEWLSGKNYWTGRPVYSPQTDSFAWHTAYPPFRAADVLTWNGHPPVSVMITLPFSLFTYENAHLAWNLVMVGLFALAVKMALRAGRRPVHPAEIIPFVALAAICFPLQTQFYQGQLNVLLLVLILGAWLADCRELDFVAGACIGAAAAIKLYPAFMLLYWLMRGKWRALAGGLASFVFLNGAAALMFGAEAYRTYIDSVIPSLSVFRGSWDNISLTGLWFKLFDNNESVHVTPLIASRPLAYGLTIVSQLVVTALAAIQCRRADTREVRNRALGLTVVAMLLVSPITWSHYSLLLLMPLAVPGLRMKSVAGRAAEYACLAVLWVPTAWPRLFAMGPEVVGNWLSKRHLMASALPWQVLCGLAIPIYALLLLFILYWRSFSPQPAKARTVPLAGNPSI